MRRLLLSAAALSIAALPVAPAQAGPAVCVVTAGFPVCAGTCRAGDPITVVAAPFSSTGTASCGGTTVSCTAFKVPCTDSGTASGSGALQCSGSAPVVICIVGIAAR
ncbi:MAG TPA: hypothetical protein VNA20_05855 [Frankiaceae bacterium]|nr:hypothetical protein [Frankiaceae bacterium]